MRLEITHQDGDVEILEFDQSPIVVGRGSKCDLRVTGEGISRQHCQLEEKEGQFFVTDLGSSNGTFVNEEKIDAHTPTQFNTFFPIIVGSGTIVSLLGEEDGRAATKAKSTLDRKRKGKTQPASATASMLASGANEYKPTGNSAMSSMMGQDATGEFNLDHAGGRPRKSKKKKQALDPKQAALVLILGAAGLFYFMTMEEDTGFVQQAPVVKKIKKRAVVKTKDPTLDLSTISNQTVLDYSKCLNDNEKAYCDDFSFQDYYEGFVIKGEALFVAIHLDNQVKDFKFKNHLTSDEGIELNRLKNIEEKAKSRNANFKGFDVDEQMMAQGIVLSIIYNTSFAGRLLSDNKIKKVYLVGFIRKSGKPYIKTSLILDKSKFSRLVNERYQSAFKMLVIGKHSQRFSQEISPIIATDKSKEQSGRKRR